MNNVVGDEHLLQKIEEKYFNHDCIELVVNEVQCILNDKLVLGCKAGPKLHVSNLFHEMAHFVEIDDERVCTFGWGLRLPEVWIFDRFYIEPQTCQATQREIRVLALQAHLHDHYGCSENISYFIKAMQWMPDFCYVPLEDGKNAWDPVKEEFRIKDIDERDASKFKWITNEVERLKNQTSLCEFNKEWKRKMTVLNERIAQVKEEK